MSTQSGPDQRSEAESLIDILVGLRVDRVRAFMERVGLPRAGTKADLHERATAGFGDGTFSIVDDLIDYLDEVEPWGRQHVILLEAKQSAAAGLCRSDGIRRRAHDAGLEHLLDHRRRQVLPADLVLSAIRSEGDMIEVVAVERREYDVREPKYDTFGQTAAGGQSLAAEHAAAFTFEVIAHTPPR
jgi:hypothetical protein